ncbi:MAG: hypothetical protein L3J59_12495 [Methylococcaceae bacterium]|nr:hypothetical protein [Methylococcaceae bacterium]
MKSTILTLSLLLSLTSLNVLAESEYLSDSRLLIIPKIKKGNGFIYNATLKLNDAGSFDIVGYSETTPSGSEGSTCTADKITHEKFNQISNGMTLEQVNSIVGCNGELEWVTPGMSGDRSAYAWYGENRPPEITIHIENNIVVLQYYTP